MTQEQLSTAEKPVGQLPTIDYSLVSQENKDVIRDFEAVVRADPGRAEQLLDIASRLFEGKAFGDLTFDENSEEAIATSNQLPTVNHNGTREDKARRTVAIVLKRSALFAGRLVTSSDVSAPAA